MIAADPDLEVSMARLSPLDVLRGLARIIAARPRRPRQLEGNAMLATILDRRSHRRFKPIPVPDTHWDAVLEAGRLAPSTVNLQTWSFAHFTAESWRATFDRRIPFDAPRAVIVLADGHRVRKAIPDFPEAPLCEYTVAVMNASLAAMNMCVAAESLGLATVMLSETGRTGFYDAAYLGEVLGLPERVTPIMTIACGWPAKGQPAMPPKLPMEAVAFEGAYRETTQTELEDWLLQMRAGYQAGHKGEDFSAKLTHYARRIDEAEIGLQSRVLGE